MPERARANRKIHSPRTCILLHFGRTLKRGL